jgi:hypothetical protein
MPKSSSRSELELARSFLWIPFQATLLPPAIALVDKILCLEIKVQVQISWGIN